MKRFYLNESKPIDQSQTANTGESKPVVETFENHIYFYSEVTPERAMELIKRLREIDSILQHELIIRETPGGQPPPIWLHIQSGGGSVFAGFSAADQIDRLQTPIYSVVEGYCASAATLISMACNWRCIQPNGFMMIHQLSNSMWGKYQDFKDEMKLMDMAMDRVIKFYTDKTRMKKKEVRKLLKHDSWFNAKRCLKLGLVDEVLG